MQTISQELEFQAEGEIVYSVFCDRGRHDQEKRVISKRQFRVARKGQQWKIRTTTQNEAVQYDEMGCDGVQIHSLCQINEEKIQREQGPLPPDCRTALGRIRHGMSPAGMDSDLMLPLWLAFCSGDYFRRITGNRIVAPEFFQGDGPEDKAAPVRYLRPATWQLNGAGLPSKIDWRPEGKEYGYPPPFDGEFLRASFEVQEWNEFGGLMLPATFGLKTFFPNKLQFHPDPTQGELCVSWMVEAKAHSFRGLSSFSWRPDLAKTALITDGRYRGNFCSDGCLSYSSAVWMTEAEVEEKNQQHGIQCERQTPQD